MNHTYGLLSNIGPWAFPLIGSAIQVALADPDIPFVALQKLAKQYGNIMSVQLGSVHAGMPS